MILRASLLLAVLASAFTLGGCAVRATAPKHPVPSTVAADAGAIAELSQHAGTADAGAAAPKPGSDSRSRSGDEAMLLPPAPDDPTAAKRLDFRGGDPVVPVRIMEGQSAVTFVPRGRMRLHVFGPVEKTVEAPAGSTWTVRIRQGSPAQLAVRIQLGEFQLADKDGIAAEEKVWRERGYAVRTEVLGSLYGIAGKVIDNRRNLLLLEEAMDASQASARQAELLRKFGLRTSLFEQVTRAATGILELLDDAGSSVALGEGRMTAEALDGSGFQVRKVEYGVGYDFHNFEDRAYRGGLELVPDRNGQLAVVNLVPLELLLQGLVPSEIFARAPMEALKAQAVTARGEVLAKIGLKHLADPYLLCSEQHCAVYKGLSGEAPTTNAAVQATRGQALFDREGRLVDSVYSAVCGGHTENNEVVWGGLPDPSLRGVPDLLGNEQGLPTPDNLEAFLDAELPSPDRLTSFAQPSKYRWQRRFTADEVNQLTASLGVGKVMAIQVAERGVSGRARLLTIAGETGATQVRGELNIRRLFGMLNSAMFLVHPETGPDGKVQAWVFKGGGWGHGVGMCQTGAAGRAEAGQSYRTILRHYFNGAEVSRIY